LPPLELTSPELPPPEPEPLLPGPLLSEPLGDWLPLSDCDNDTDADSETLSDWLGDGLLPDDSLLETLLLS